MVSFLLGTLLSRRKKGYWSLFLQLCLIYTGEEKILLPGQAAWATAGEQLMILLTTGAGAAYFIPLTTWLTTEIYRTDHSYLYISA